METRTRRRRSAPISLLRGASENHILEHGNILKYITPSNARADAKREGLAALERSSEEGEAFLQELQTELIAKHSTADISVAMASDKLRGKADAAIHKAVWDTVRE